MERQQQSIAWAQIFVTALLSLVASVAYFHYTNRAPELIYEIFPPAHFTNAAKKIGIYNLRIENIGDKEAESVEVFVELPFSSEIQDFKVEPSSKSIAYAISTSTSSNARQVSFSLLNPGESSRFSILVTATESAQLKVDIRGKGTVGKEGLRKEEGTNWWLAAIALIVGILSTGVATATVRGQVRNLTDLVSSQETLISHGLRIIRTSGKTPITRLEELLVGKKYRLVFNPTLPISRGSKIITFGKSGQVEEGKNDNETSWSVKNDLLEIRNSSGQIHNRFYFSPTEQIFYSTNDADAGALLKHAIPNQHIVPVDSSVK